MQLNVSLRTETNNKHWNDYTDNYGVVIDELDNAMKKVGINTFAGGNYHANEILQFFCK